MKTNFAQFLALFTTAGIATGVVGCRCVFCPETEKAGIPIILCQPTDQKVATNEDAVFRIKAKGENLSYQWFFENPNGISAVPDVRGPELVVSATNPDRYGLYWSVVKSEGPQGLRQNSTPKFALTPQLAALPGSTNVPEQEPIYVPFGGPFQSPCCNFCGYGVYNNKGNGPGWPIKLHETFKFEILNASGQILNTTNYCVVWAIPTDSGCCSAVSGTETDLFAPKLGNYVFTVYIKTSCPPQGTLFTLNPLP